MAKDPNVVKYGGVELTILNQNNEYVPAFSSPIKLPKEFEKAIATAVKNNLPALFMGETGTGKTSAAREIAYMRKQGYTRINMTGYTTPDELIGSKSVKDGSTYYEDGILTKAMKEGHIVVLDEINATPPECSFILHGLLDDDRRVSLPNGDIIWPHKDFRLFATMNPDYEGTRGVNRALLDRFNVILNFTLPKPDKEIQILMEKSGVTAEIAERMVTLANGLRQSYAEQKTLTFVSLRSLLQWAGLVVNGGVDTKPAYVMSIANKARAEERSAFMDMYSAVFKDKPEEQADAIVMTTKRKLDSYEKQIQDLQDAKSQVDRQLCQVQQEVDQFKVFQKQAEATAKEYEALKDMVKKAMAKSSKTSGTVSEGEQPA